MHVTVLIKHLHYYKLNYYIEKQGNKLLKPDLGPFKINYRFH